MSGYTCDLADVDQSELDTFKVWSPEETARYFEESFGSGIIPEQQCPGDDMIYESATSEPGPALKLYEATDIQDSCRGPTLYNTKPGLLNWTNNDSTQEGYLAPDPFRADSSCASLSPDTDGNPPSNKQKRRNPRITPVKARCSNCEGRKPRVSCTHLPGRRPPICALCDHEKLQNCDLEEKRRKKRQESDRRYREKLKFPEGKKDDGC